jgi:hypothetical protein
VDNSYFYHLLRMAVASAICTAMIGFGLYARRGDHSRRWLFVVAGFLCSAMTAFTIIVNSGGYPRDFSPILGFFLGIALVLPAASLIFVGWKGRRVGDHPHCRKCGFDLFGKPPDSTRCGECGADLADDRSMVTGIRQTRRGLVLTGLFTLILGLMLMGEASREYFSNADLYRFLPTWWLLHERDSLVNRNRAEAALQAELGSANLTHWQAQLIAERVLTNLEAGRPDDLFYRLITVIDQRDLLDETTTRRLMRQVAQLGFLATPPLAVRGRLILLFDTVIRARPGGRAPMNLNLSLSNLYWSVTSSAFRIGQFVVPASDVTPAPARVRQQPSWSESAINLADDWPKIPSGSVTISRDLTLAVTLNFRGKLLAETSKFTSQCATRVVAAR